jgi:GNAT superfamily N-acetyltransferase
VRALCRGDYGERQIESWTRPREIERLQAQVAADPAFVACLGAELVGYSQVRPSSGEILAVYVRPTSTGQGIGAALLAAAEQVALGSGSGLCSLWVDASLNAEVFYAACGNVAQRKTSFVLDDGVALPCVRMGKSARARNAP